MHLTATDVTQIAPVQVQLSSHRFKNQTSLKALENQNLIDLMGFEDVPTREHKT